MTRDTTTTSDLYQDFVVREKEDTDAIMLVGMQQNCVLIFICKLSLAELPVYNDPNHSI